MKSLSAWSESIEELPAIYIHVPFCHSICPFCSFSVIQNRSDLVEKYFHVLKQEMTIFAELTAKLKKPVESVYFGGGTPSLPGATFLKNVKQLIEASFPVSSETQWSIEINPEDCSQSFAEEVFQSGFNRASLGVQSFSDAQLEGLRRNHKSLESKKALNELKKAGFKDINLDIMFGYPELTEQELAEDINSFLDHEPQHISAYSLNLENGSQWYQKKSLVQWLEDNENRVTEQYLFIHDKLGKSGIKQYEVSNFSIPGYESRQNLLNWTGKNYLGLGLGAHSMIENTRWNNPSRWVDYFKPLSLKSLPELNIEPLSDDQIRDEYLMTRLRMLDGIVLKDFLNLFMVDMGQVINENFLSFVKTGLVVLTDERMFLSPRGLLLADEITLKIVSYLDYKRFIVC